MEEIYFWSLMTGIAIPLLSLLLGGILDGLDFDFDFDLGFDIVTFLPFTPSALSVFLLGFGGIGLFSMEIVSFHLVIALLSGITFTYLFNKHIVERLKKAQREVHTLDSLIGLEAVVHTAILADSIGEIVITTDTGIHVYMARSSKAIPLFETVLITGLEDGVFFVEAM